MKNYSFIDMHIHTDYSNEELCDLTIEQLLTMAQKRAQKIGKDCVISIADHNSILGVKEAKKILNSPEGKVNYPNVKLINGIEFTTDLIELCDQFDGDRVFTRCHTLAYGYDENNAELTAYSRITHKFFSKDDNVGMQICAARRAVCEHYNINLPFTVFEPMVDMKSGTNFKNEFIHLLLDYAKGNKISINRNEVDKLISPYIINHVDYVREASSFGRLKLSDISHLIKNAGGELVIAHPALIRVTVDGLKKIAKKEGLELSDIYAPTVRKFNNNTDLMHVKRKKLVFEYFIDAFNKTCDKDCQMRGIEKYYSSNMSSGLDKAITAICEEQGMYETCGSDYHGIHLHSDKTLGNVFNNQIQKAYKDICGYFTEDKSPLMISGITSVEYLLDKTKKGITNQTTLGNDKGENIPVEDYEKVISSVAKKSSHKYEKPEETKSTLSMDERIAELTDVAQRLNEIISKSDSKAKQAKLLLRLNLFVENIYSALRVLKDKAYNNYKIRTILEYEEICTLMADIKNKFKGLMRNNPQMIKDLKKDMKHYYKKNAVVVHRMVDLEFPKPLKMETTATVDTGR